MGKFLYSTLKFERDFLDIFFLSNNVFTFYNVNMQTNIAYKNILELLFSLNQTFEIILATVSKNRTNNDINIPRIFLHLNQYKRKTFRYYCVLCSTEVQIVIWDHIVSPVRSSASARSNNRDFVLRARTYF